MIKIDLIHAPNFNDTLGVYRIHETSISAKKERTMIKEAFQVQWKAFRKFGGSFWKMTQSLSKRGLAWFVPTQVRSGFRDTQRK